MVTEAIAVADAVLMADVVVMDTDLEAIDPDQLGQTRAAVTICGGRITYQA